MKKWEKRVGMYYLYNQAHFKGSIAINARGPTGPSVLIIAILL